MLEYFARAVEQLLDQLRAVDAERLGAAVDVEPVSGLVLHLGDERDLSAQSDGARVIQLPSGSMPTISECACCDIMRTSCRRYFSGIQSFGSMLSPAAMRASKAATFAGSSGWRGGSASGGSRARGKRVRMSAARTWSPLHGADKIYTAGGKSDNRRTGRAPCILPLCLRGQPFREPPSPAATSPSRSPTESAPSASRTRRATRCPARCCSASPRQSHG